MICDNTHSPRNICLSAPALCHLARLKSIHYAVFPSNIFFKGGVGDTEGSNDEDGNYDEHGKPIAEAQRGTLRPGTMNTINAEFESFDYTETSSALRYVSMY